MARRSIVSPSRFFISALFCAGVAAACGGAHAPVDGQPGTDSDPEAGAGSGNGVGTFGDGGGGGGSVLGDAACATVSSKAQQQPLDIYIMLDQSESMSESVTGGTKWSAVSSALTTFVNQASLAGVGVGLGYFGVPPGAAAVDAGACPSKCKVDADCGTNGTCIGRKCLGCGGGGGGGGFGDTDSCNAADYAIPDVEIATLPGVAPAITQSITAHSPSTDTPTSAALQGAVDHAKAWATAHPGHVTIALLATDGEPTECDTDLDNINAIAAAAATGTPKVLTFVIGVGTSFVALNGIAAAGGTGTAYIADTNANVNQEFLSALNAIRGAALGCQYQIPVPKVGGSLDYGAVNVQYTPSGGGAPVIVPKVQDKSMCPAAGNAWFYDNNTAPTQIILCDTSCKALAGDLTGSVSVVVGCSTVVR